MEIKVITFEEIKPHIKEAEKESLSFCQKTKYLGYFDNENLVGFAGVIVHKRSVTFKNGFIFKPYRGKGYYKQLFSYRLNLFRGYVIHANCTPMSINLYLRCGFKIVKKYKNGITGVKYENFSKR